MPVVTDPLTQYQRKTLHNGFGSLLNGLDNTEVTFAGVLFLDLLGEFFGAENSTLMIDMIARMAKDRLGSKKSRVN